MAIDTGSTSPNGSKLSGRCQPYVDVYQITPGSGGFTVYYRIGMYCYTINWSARNYTVTCTGATSQTKSMSFNGGNNNSRTYIQGASGSFWVSNPTGASKSFTVGFSGSSLGFSYGGYAVNSLSVTSRSYTQTNTPSTPTKCRVPSSCSVSPTSTSPGNRVTITWSGASGGNPVEHFKNDLNKTGKTIVCGHWHTSAAHSELHNEGSEWGEDANFNPFYDNHLIMIDGCITYSKQVNIIELEDDLIA